jgi:predicted nicotinamide N-methyase
VLDLPQIYTKPSGQDLLLTLDNLKSEPSTWQTSNTVADLKQPKLDSGKVKVRSQGLPSYLTKIISSPLTWIDDDAVKEAIWESAAQCLSERSGRSAMGSITRTFAIPLASPSEDDAAAATARKTAPEGGVPTLNIVLHEPALTADNVGFKTWASSHLLAQRMVSLKHSLPLLPDDAIVLELGAGTGLVGLAAAGILRRTVLLTDLPPIISNLERNIETNKSMLNAVGARAIAAVLDWTEPQGLDIGSINTSDGFLLVLAADTVYTSEQPVFLTQTIACHLRRDARARAVITVPQRDGFEAELKDFQTRMLAAGLHVVEDGEEFGYDDWASKHNDRNEGDLAKVKCYWSVWAWQ